MFTLACMFLLELASLAAFARWGHRFGLWAAIGIPVLVLVVWSLFLAPKASIPVFFPPVREVLKLVVFAAASAALYASGLSGWAVAMLAVSVIVVALIFSLGLVSEMPDDIAK
uniref:DUF2568 domain-containing protein n=2 Tax=Cohnella candidum TaxID=2674991 RepID=A0A3G3K5N4_9BACL|nr:DUF2568 domain-containing protein [Cohnella candidum]